MVDSHDNATRPAAALQEYINSLQDFPLVDREDLEKEGREAWSHAYRKWSLEYGGVEGFHGPVGPLDAEKLIVSWQEELRGKMRKVCGRLEKPELLLALRMVPPSGDPWEYNQYAAMGARRIASHAVLLFGRDPNEGYAAPYGGVVESPYEKKRFAKTFRELIHLASEYLRAYGCRPLIAAGMSITVGPEGPQVPDEEARLKLRETLYSSDGRSHAYYSPLTRVGEFSAGAVPIRRVNGVSLISTRYLRFGAGRWMFDSVAWDLAPLKEFLVGMDQDLCLRAWGMTGEEFFCLLAGLCHMILDTVTQSRATNEDWRSSSVVPLERAAVEGSKLLRVAEEYSRRIGLKPGDFDLAAAQSKFLWLACSSGKEDIRERPLKIQLGDTRFSYLLHRFGRFYVVDLFHSDHWLHRPLELLANQMVGEESRKKGRRFEDRLWEYMTGLRTLRPVPELRRQKIYIDGNPKDDLDFTFALGTVLILADAKAELLRYPAETMYHNAVQSRWKDTTEYLTKIGETAEVLAAQHNQPNFSRGMSGIKYILPLVCRPYPEWVLSLDDTYWLRKPNKAAEELGIPRILTPGELRNFFETMTERELVRTVGQHMIHVGRYP